MQQSTNAAVNRRGEPRPKFARLSPNRPLAVKQMAARIKFLIEFFSEDTKSMRLQEVKRGLHAYRYWEFDDAIKLLEQRRLLVIHRVPGRGHVFRVVLMQNARAKLPDPFVFAEIKRLWQQTTARAKQRVEQAQTSLVTDVTSDGDDYYIDGFGNAIPGKRPPKKTAETYVDANGYVQEGQAPHTSGNSLVDWLNTVDISHDPEVREALGENNLFFEQPIAIGENKILLTGRLESKGWIVDSRSDDPKLNLGFRLPRRLTRDQAIEEAAAYVESKAGPQFKTLFEDEERMIERMAVTNRLQAFLFYIQARLPDDLANRLGAAGDELGIQRFAAEKEISEIVEDGVFQAFRWNNIRVGDEFLDFVQANHGGRIIAFALLDNLWNQYNFTASVDRLNAEPPPTAEDFDATSDEQISDLLTRTRKLRNQTR
jgi:hypothetical protein